MARPLSKFGWLAMVQAQPADILDANARAVAAALVMEADRDAVALSCGIGVLVGRTALSRRTVLRGLGSLERDSWLVLRRGGGGQPGQSRKVTNNYRMTVPSWARSGPDSGCHTDTQTGDSGCHTGTQTSGPERQSGCHTGTLLRGKNKGVGVRADETPTDEPPISGQQIRDILNARRTRPLHAVTSTPDPGIPWKDNHGGSP